MPRPDIKHFSAWLLLEPDVMNLLHRKAEPTGEIEVCGWHIWAAIVVAINPDTLTASLNIPEAAELARVFCEFYSKSPDLTIVLMPVIRKTWNDDSIAAKVRRQCLTKIWLTRPQNEDSGTFTTEARNSEVLWKVGPDLKATALDAVKKARQKFRRRKQVAHTHLGITAELKAALLVLRERGFDVGDGM